MTVSEPAAPADPWSANVNLERLLAALLLAPQAHAQWLSRLQALAQRVGELVRAQPDAWLYVVFQRAAQPTERYSIRHALACAAVAELAGIELGFDDARRRRLAGAALTMNLGMTGLQNELAHRHQALTPQQRDAVREHPLQGAARLRELGLDDAEWLAIVERHHDTKAGAEDDGDPVGLATALLRRVDVLLAKLSPRAGRKPLASIAGVRAACLGPDGRPDRVGIALIRALGFHPPGTCVRLASGEWAVVLCRGARPDQPRVACVMDAQRRPLPQPLLRSAADAGFAVASAVAATELRWAFPADQLLGRIAEPVTA